jgi:hypothetical protein
MLRNKTANVNKNHDHRPGGFIDPKPLGERASEKENVLKLHLVYRIREAWQTGYYYWRQNIDVL